MFSLVSISSHPGFLFHDAMVQGPPYQLEWWPPTPIVKDQPGLGNPPPPPPQPCSSPRPQCMMGEGTGLRAIGLRLKDFLVGQKIWNIAGNWCPWGMVQAVRPAPLPNLFSENFKKNWLQRDSIDLFYRMLSFRMYYDIPIWFVSFWWVCGSSTFKEVQ